MKHIHLKLFFLSGFLLTGFTLHKYYVSVMEIHPNFKEHKLEIVLRTFPDDMETAMKEWQKKTHQKPAFETFVRSYIKEKIRFAINGKETDYNILGMMEQDEYLIILMEIPLPENEPLKQITIENRFLLDQFNEQKNIVHFLNGKDKKSFILNKRNRLLQLEL